MPIPTWAVFESATNNLKTFQRARGPNIAMVDDALKRWQAREKRANLAEREALLAAILTACSKWLKLKMDNNPDELRLRRRAQISALAEAALDELKKFGAVGLSQTELDRRNAFDRRKFEVLGGRKRIPNTPPAGTPAGGALRSLSPGYIHERNMYLEANKQAPYSGTRMQQYFDLGPNAQMRGTQFGNKGFTQLTEEEFRKLASLAEAAGCSATVAFQNKTERMDLWVKPGEMGKFYDIHGKLVHAWDSGLTTWAMDEYGNLFVATYEQRRGKVGPAQIFSHSSFNAGKPVLCAGMISIEKGVLTHIDNSSGHYKPSREDLANALQCLKDDGADLSQAGVTVLEFEPTGGLRMVEFTALAFLDSPKAKRC